MNFVDAVKSVFTQYVGFSGRASRSEFWWWALFVLGASLVLSMVSEDLYGIFALGVLLPGLAVGARRLHDVGKSGWWQLMYFVPLLGLLLIIYWAVQPSEGPNDFGGGPDRL